MLISGHVNAKIYDLFVGYWRNRVSNNIFHAIIISNYLVDFKRIFERILRIPALDYKI